MPYDVIIIGGGIAGLSTAVRCTELGLRPIVLEKGKTGLETGRISLETGIIVLEIGKISLETENQTCDFPKRG